MKDLSIIVVSYNTSDTTRTTVTTAIELLSSQQLSYEIFVVDNDSQDESVEMIKTLQKNHKTILKPIFLKENVGFAKANNVALAEAEGKYILFLNSDVVLEHVDFSALIKHMDSYHHVGALTVTVNLPTGSIDPASHRGFPTLWRSFCYFTGLERIFGSVPLLNRVFGGYHLLHCDLTKNHEIDSPSGAFFFTRKALMDTLKGFDEDFFMYGEDIDLAYRMKKQGYSIEYVPNYTVIHLKYSSGLGNKDANVQKKIRGHFYNAMKIFYDKHYQNKYPSFINSLVYFIIDLRKNIS